MISRKLKLSVIVSTFNRPEALDLILTALSHQTGKNFEVIIADDGSENETRELIDKVKDKVDFKITHIWQEHKEFRAAAIRNKAIVASSGEYLLFIDGDCVPNIDFINTHLNLAEKNYFVSGNRILLSKKFTDHVLKMHVPIYKWNILQWLQALFKGDINRILPLISLNKLLYPRYKLSHKWQGAKTCNLGVWKKDFLAVGGFDERYWGWGYEDSDLVVRLMHNKILRKDGRFTAPVFHLWHPLSSRTNESENYKRLEEIIKSSRIDL